VAAKRQSASSGRLRGNRDPRRSAELDRHQREQSAAPRRDLGERALTPPQAGAPADLAPERVPRRAAVLAAPVERLTQQQAERLGVHGPAHQILEAQASHVGRERLGVVVGDGDRHDAIAFARAGPGERQGETCGSHQQACRAHPGSQRSGSPRAGHEDVDSQLVENGSHVVEIPGVDHEGFRAAVDLLGRRLGLDPALLASQLQAEPSRRRGALGITPGLVLDGVFLRKVGGSAFRSPVHPDRSVEKLRLEGEAPLARRREDSHANTAPNRVRQGRGDHAASRHDAPNPLVRNAAGADQIQAERGSGGNRGIGLHEQAHA
jgi:hypothetical protein